jgi:acetyltransferase-like isoleucine patch superfamily enzyme
MKFFKIIGLFLTYINLKTIYFNFHYLSIREALHLPVFLSRNTKLRCMKGKVKITSPVKPGMIQIGAEEIGIYDKRHNRPIWENRGTVLFHGKAVIKYGAKIVVGQKGILRLGNNFRLSSGSFIICYNSVEFGDDCRISWNTQIIDTDFHKVYDIDLIQMNPDKEIMIGNNCWIGNHCLINKGTHLGNMVVVSSNSMINKDIPESNIILAGSPAKIIKTSITWGD